MSDLKGPSRVKNSDVGKILLALALWLGCSAADAQAQAGDFVADAKSGCKV